MAHYNPIIDDPGFETDLITAASYGDCSRIQRILENPESDVNEKNASGWTALMYAAHYGHYQVVDELMKVGCDANVIDPVSGRNALMMAAANGHTYCVERLVGSGAVDLHARDSNGLTAADLASHCGHGRNTALIRALQISPTSSSLVNQRNAKTQVKRRPTPNFPITQWEQSITRNGSYLPVTSTPYNPTYGNTLARRLFMPHTDSPVAFENVSHSSFESCPSSENSTYESKVSKWDRKLLGVSSLPPKVEQQSDGDSGNGSPDHLSSSEDIRRLEDENKSLKRRVQELEKVINVFHDVTKQLIAKVQQQQL